MEKKVNVMSGLTEYGSKRIGEILESTSAWMGPESTLGDFFTAFFHNMTIACLLSTVLDHKLVYWKVVNKTDE